MPKQPKQPNSQDFLTTEWTITHPDTIPITGEWLMIDGETVFTLPSKSGAKLMVILLPHEIGAEVLDSITILIHPEDTPEHVKRKIALARIFELKREALKHNIQQKTHEPNRNS